MTTLIFDISLLDEEAAAEGEAAANPIMASAAIINTTFFICKLNMKK